MNFRKALFLVGSIVMTLGASLAMAQDGAAAAPAAAAGAGLGAWGPALTIAIAAFGGALAQGRTAAAALEGISRNPAAQGKVFVPMIIGLALIESLVLYAFVIALIKY
jgi:F-type H+-transporting ATPase subunit c